MKVIFTEGPWGVLARSDDLPQGAPRGFGPDRGRAHADLLEKIIADFHRWGPYLEKNLDPTDPTR